MQGLLNCNRSKVKSETETAGIGDWKVNMIEDIRAITTELTETESIVLEAAKEYKRDVKAAAIARFDYDLAWAKNLLLIREQANGLKVTVGEIEALTTKAVENEMREVRIKEAESDASKRYLSAVEAILSSVQTRSRLLQTEWNLLGNK